MSRQISHYVIQDPQFGLPVRLATQQANEKWFCRLCPTEGKTVGEMKLHLTDHIELMPAEKWNDSFRRSFNAQ